VETKTGASFASALSAETSIEQYVVNDWSSNVR